MEFRINRVYHVFNQGNNKQRIFFEEKNYLYFLKKVRKYILPYADILCYCLMPNHFHFLLVPKENALLPSNAVKPKKKHAAELESADENNNFYQPKLNANIGILLSSYTKAINKKYDRTGSLFRGKTKAKDGWVGGFATISEGQHLFRPDNDYAVKCFHYIHENPVKAKMVDKATEWHYSSARDYAGLRNGTLCNQDLAQKILGG